MHQHLAFVLAAPLGSFSVDTSPAANAAVKTTSGDPSKSSVIGMVAASLGLEREDIHGLGQRLMLSTMAVVNPVISRKPDYHTATPGKPLLDETTGKRLSRKHSRFEELVWSFDHRPPARWSKGNRVEGGLGSGEILSRRGFFANDIWTVTLHGDLPLLQEVSLALSSPKRALYVGRKAFPIGLPPGPLLVDATTPELAHANYRNLHPAFDKLMRDHVSEALLIPVGGGRFTVDVEYPGERRKGRVIVRRDGTAPHRPGMKNLTDRRVHVSATSDEEADQ